MTSLSGIAFGPYLDKDPAPSTDFEEVSVVDSEEGNREHEIRKVLGEELGDEIFDLDDESDPSFNNASKFSNHNNCSFVKDDEDSEDERTGSGSGDEPFPSTDHDEGIFQTPKLPFSGVNMKRVNFSDVTNTTEAVGGNWNGKPINVNGSGGGGSGDHTYGNGIGNGMEAVDRLFQQVKVNGSKRPSEENQAPTTVALEQGQNPNGTVSMLHPNHCPQTSLTPLGDGIWLSAQNNVESLKQMCEFKERQIQRAEESLSALQKDKRALNHQIALMKSEMIQMRSQCAEAEKFAQLKDEEVAYMKRRLQESIEDYEQVCRNEVAAKNETARYAIEIDKLQQEVKLLSALGSQTQQAEINDVVRQIREKHAQEITSWQNIVADLQGQIQAYKSTQHILIPESSKTRKSNVDTQTEYKVEDEFERSEREIAVQEFQEELGACSEAFIHDIMSLPERDIVRRVRQEWKAERDKLVSYYDSEIKVYKQKLTTLPSELYHKWQQMQEELGLNKPMIIKPIVRSIGTTVDEDITGSKVDMSTSLNNSILAIVNTKTPSKEEGVQVTLAAAVDSVDTAKSVKSATCNTDVPHPKETSSVVVQTEETLETYQVLATLIDSWANEVKSNKQRALLAESKNDQVQEELKLLSRKFKQLQKVALTCRREWKKQEESLQATNAQLKAHYVDMLQKLNDKLTLADQEM